MEERWIRHERPTMRSSLRPSLLARRGERGKTFTVFTDSTAAVERVTSDAPGLGQEIEIGVIDLAQRLVDQGNRVTVRWTPAHRGVEGNKQADQRARQTAALPLPRGTTRRYSLPSSDAGQRSEPPVDVGKRLSVGTPAERPLDYRRRLPGQASGPSWVGLAREWLRGFSSY